MVVAIPLHSPRLVEAPPGHRARSRPGHGSQVAIGVIAVGSSARRGGHAGDRVRAAGEVLVVGVPALGEDVARGAVLDGLAVHKAAGRGPTRHADEPVEAVIAEILALVEPVIHPPRQVADPVPCQGEILHGGGIARRPRHEVLNQAGGRVQIAVRQQVVAEPLAGDAAERIGLQRLPVARSRGAVRPELAHQVQVPMAV